MDFENVDIVRVEHAHYCVERARSVLQLDLEPGDPPGAGEIA